MTVSLRHLSLTITQKKPGLIITVYVLPQNHSTERIITTARAVCFNIKKKKIKKTKQETTTTRKTGTHTKSPPTWGFQGSPAQLSEENFRLPQDGTNCSFQFIRAYEE